MIIKIINTCVDSNKFKKSNQILFIITSIIFKEKGSHSDKDKHCLLANILAYEGKFKEAARIYQKWGFEHLAFTMYTDLRMFDLAQVVFFFIILYIF